MDFFGVAIYTFAQYIMFFLRYSSSVSREDYSCLVLRVKDMISVVTQHRFAQVLCVLKFVFEFVQHLTFFT
jgi:hypothetical protein